MPDTKRLRIDYMPGAAAQDALERAVRKYPDLRQQALIDRLVICGMSALEFEHWRAPPLLGPNRDRWRTAKKLPVGDSENHPETDRFPGANTRQRTGT